MNGLNRKSSLINIMEKCQIVNECEELRKRIAELGVFETRCKKAEKSLRESEERYNTLAKLSPVGIFRTDTNGQWIYVNDRLCEIAGLTPESLYGLAWAEAIHPDDRCRILDEWNRAKQTNIIFNSEYRFQRPDGITTWVIGQAVPETGSSGEVIGYLGTVTDFTDRRWAEDVLQNSVERYRVLVEHTPSAIIVHSEGKIVFSNNVGIRLLGASDAGELIGRSILDFVHPDYRETAKERCRLMKDEGKEVPLMEEKYIRLDGKIIDVEVAAIPFIYDGKLTIHAVVHDITEKKITENIRIENERLAYASKAKSEFLASMSHELRTPLNSIIGFSELLKQKGLDQKQERYIDNVITSSRFLLGLINDILDLSKVEAGKLELVIEKMSVPDTIDETVMLIKEKASKNRVTIKKEFDPHLDLIEADKQRFKQILFNLLGNAVKFSKEDGGTIAIKVKKEGDMAEVSVSDTGIGIKEKDLERLFDKFQQLDSGITKKYGGTGLGLSISKKLIEMHGGEIIVKSKYGEGTTFIFKLPIVQNIK
jgi:PAS domain S-box-containing protein